MMSAGQPPVRGKQAIRAHLAEATKIPGFKIRWEPLEGKVSGDMGYLLERTHMTMNRPDGTPVTDTMQAVTVWRKAPDGSWKNVVDASIPAADVPAQPAT
jgi:ketosteroid isomerase-like protein